MASGPSACEPVFKKSIKASPKQRTAAINTPSIKSGWLMTLIVIEFFAYS
ncbi:hypothetical protein QWZ13_15785 [Reinekea marina]|nr:hypothetical protein [Reinekea marina]MDN3650368.1 hypothetical protein [Reinekea marina]